MVGAHAVMANGGVIAPVGHHMVALAAHRHAVPFVVLAASHKVACIFV
jgi:translation initiation factor eIF-2B subunit beta